MPATGKRAQKRKQTSTVARPESNSASTATPAKKSSKNAMARQSNAFSRNTDARRSSIASVSTSNSRHSVTNPSDASMEPSSDSEEPEFILAEIEHEQPLGGGKPLTDEVSIPQDLIHRLLHHHFQDKDKTSINPGAKEVICKYVEVFVREGLARSAFMRQEADGEDGDAGDGFLEVEDLEKCAPLLVLDF